ncbi:hypothetical protein Tco_1559738, partial [Tanacetum coccineum]
LNKRLKELQALSSSSQNMAFVSSPNSTNEVNTAYGVSTTNTQVSPTSTQVSTAKGFSRKLVEKSLSIEVTQLDMTNPSWSVSTVTRWDTMQGDAEDLGTKIAGTGIKTSLKGLYMADNEVPANMALIDFSDSEVHNDKTCSNYCLKSFENLKTQLDDLRIEFNKSEFNLENYKRGLASVEEQLVFYKKNEVIFCEQIVVLKRDISYKDSELSMLSKSLDKLIGSQIPDKRRKGVGFVSYNVVPPPPTGLFSPPKFDLSSSGLEEFQQPKFDGYGPKTSKIISEDMSNEVKESPDTPLVKELVLDDKLEKKTIFPTIAKIEFIRPKQQEKPVRKPVKYAEMYRSQSPRGNQRNWNNQKSQQLGSDFLMYNKACFVYGSFNYV